MAHAIRLFSSIDEKDNPDHVPAPEPPELPNVVPDRIQENVIEAVGEEGEPLFTEVVEDERQDVSVVDPDPDEGQAEESYMRGIYRFSDADDKHQLVTRIEEEVVADAEWYLIESHVCDHDQSANTGCSGWETEAEDGDHPWTT